MKQPDSRVPAFIAAANPKWLAHTLVWTTGFIALAWFYLSALIPLDWPMRWFLIYLIPVAASVGMSRWARDPFPLGKWFLLGLISLVSIFDFTAFVIAVGTGVIVWPAAKTVASAITGRPILTATEKAQARRTKKGQKAGKPRNTDRKARP